MADTACVPGLQRDTVAALVHCLCCDTGGTGMHRLLCEPGTGLVRYDDDSPSDTVPECHTDTCADRHTDGLADLRAERSTDSSADTAADDCVGVCNEAADTAAECEAEHCAERSADTYTELVADTRADELTDTHFHVRADAAEVRLPAAGVLCGVQHHFLQPCD